MTQPVYSFADAIEQRIWVETPLDTDHDGKLDRVVADISRPRETDTEGCKVPVIFEQSPYRKGVWFDVPYPSVLVDQLPQITRQQDRVTGDYTQFWRERDYVPAAGRVRASVLVVHGINHWT